MDQQLPELESRLEQAQSPRERIDALNGLAYHLRHTARSRGLELAQAALNLAEAEGYKPGVATALQNICFIHQSMGENGLALRPGLQAIDCFIELGDRHAQAITLRTVGQLYVELGSFPKGLEIQLKAVELFRSLGDTPNAALALTFVGIAHSMAGDSKQAVECYQQALDVFIEIGELRRQAVVLNSCCVDYVKLGEHEQARECGKRAMMLFQQVGDDYGVAVSRSSLGEVALGAGDHQSAIDLFERGLELFQQSRPEGISNEAFETMLNLGKAWQLQGDIQKAIEWTRNALANAEQHHSQRLAMECHKTLVELYEANRDTSAALAHIKQYVSLREQMMSETNQRTLANLRVLSETREALAESERQKTLREEERQRFERLTQLREDFLHYTTHDIKNPLTIIGTSSALLRMRLKPTDEKVIEYLDQIEYGFTRIRQLLEDMLDLARLETLPALQLEPVALYCWLEGIIAEIRTLAEAKQILVKLDVVPADLVIQCNPLRLQQAVVNLLSNAIKYTPEKGAVFIKASSSGSQVQVQVIDNGIGIPSEAIPHLFDRFYRVHNYSVNIEGTGLGLSIVKLAIEQQGGTVKVESEPGRGTIFTLSLPMLGNR